MNDNEQVEFSQKLKNKLYQDLVQILNSLPEDYKGDIDSLEKKLAGNIVMLIGCTVDELKHRYCISRGYDRWGHLEEAIKAERDKWDKEMEQCGLELQWNPDFYEYFKKKMSGSEPDDES
ncbi:MAG: hypothetical protein CEE38_08480 [Planctomycetes bacterium B3_Pla]|nr:MAG: hypothetical protein CEE38_08480 [Planctomycetes bacterium B3_Pla]